jgi:hypothetical protein
MQSGQDGSGLVATSRLVAKVDSAAVQDGYQLYHHTFCFTPGGSWCVVQQGMNDGAGLARRYHWLSETVTDFACEPHSGIVQGRPAAPAAVLNLVAREGEESRRGQVALSRLEPAELARFLGPEFTLPAHHGLDVNPFRGKRLAHVAAALHEAQAEDFTGLLSVSGVGAKALRSLAFVAEVVYGAPPSFRDPAVYSHAHGGKDGIPFPVQREEYDRNIDVLREAVNRAKLGHYDKAKALKRLARTVSGTP